MLGRRLMMRIKKTMKTILIITDMVEAALESFIWKLY